MTKYLKEHGDADMKVCLGGWIGSMSNFEKSNDLFTYHIKSKIPYTFVHNHKIIKRIYLECLRNFILFQYKNSAIIV